jgi:putative glycosyltransferase (TIGR04372 family)
MNINSYFKYFFKYSLCWIALLPIYLIGPFFLIRLNKLPTEVIGSLAEGMETYLCKKKEQKTLFQLDLFCFGEISNSYLASLVKKKVHVLPKFFTAIFLLNEFLSRYIFFIKKHTINFKELRDINDLYSKYPPNFSFSKKEINSGWNTLEKIGVPRGSKFVCLDIRDKKYKLKSDLISRDMSYHNFRNFDSDNFLLAANNLAKKGLYVIRMGKAVEKKFISSNKKIIDYANSNYASDFMDIFIGANCEFCLTTATGIDTIPLIFRKPIAGIVVPVAFVQTYSKKFINITKHHYLNGKKLNAKEIFENNLAFLLDKKFYDEKKVTLKEPKPKEISDFAIEAYDLFVKKKSYRGNELKIQKNYQKKLHDYMVRSKLYDKYYQENIQPVSPKGFFGVKFIKQNNFF